MRVRGIPSEEIMAFINRVMGPPPEPVDQLSLSEITSGLQAFAPRTLPYDSISLETFRGGAEILTAAIRTEMADLYPNYQAINDPEVMEIVLDSMELRLAENRELSAYYKFLQQELRHAADQQSLVQRRSRTRSRVDSGHRRLFGEVEDEDEPDREHAKKRLKLDDKPTIGKDVQEFVGLGEAMDSGVGGEDLDNNMTASIPNVVAPEAKTDLEKAESAEDSDEDNWTDVTTEDDSNSDNDPSYFG